MNKMTTVLSFMDKSRRITLFMLHSMLVVQIVLLLIRDGPDVETDRKKLN